MQQKGVFVTGTDTDVGKTYVGQLIIRQLREGGIKVIPRKPVESGWSGDINKTDAGLLAKAAGCEGELDKVCPNRFKAAISPVRAARLEGCTLQLKEVSKQCLSDVNKSEFLYVEGAGGFFSPLVSANEHTAGLNADLAKSLEMPVLLIAEDRLGCINHVLLTIAAIKACELSIVGVILNVASEASDKGQMNNFDDLKGLLLDIPVFQLGYGKNNVSDPLLESLKGVKIKLTIGEGI